MGTEREQGNFPDTILDAEWEIIEAAKAEHLPVSNSSCIPGTIGMSKVISSGEESRPGIVSTCLGCIPSCQQGQSLYSGRQQPDRLLMLPLPRTGRCLMPKVSGDKKIYKQKRDFFFLCLHAAKFDRSIFLEI